ncbi:hypothetical protein EYZ11_009787 [Aspergillus tanneri]|uniref:Uncharacterized protein n=1 Tax=Aspergillus tanneri TaxID=1220188 RepID=A0A4S3J720_9EURO|nr:hypothetical protein EYZ11_009787 [Aspergillus tanneri]
MTATKNCKGYLSISQMISQAPFDGAAAIDVGIGEEPNPHA